VDESFLGRHLLPIIAAVLGLVGLVFLGILVVPQLPSAARIALMFVISGGVGGLGYLLHRRRDSVLTQALVGMGVGGVFVSILVTHVYFRVLPDVVAFGLLACWIVGSLWSAKRLHSLLVAILAHVGMVASIGYGYLGLSDDVLVLVVVYQIVATVALLVGSMMWMRQMYRFGLFASQVMVVVSTTMMWSRFMGVGVGFDSSLATGWIVAAFAVQFLGGTVVAYLLFVSCTRVKQPLLAGGLVALLTVLWLVTLTECGSILISKLQATALGLDSLAVWNDPRTIAWAALVSGLVACLPTVGWALSAPRVNLKPDLERWLAIPLASHTAIVAVVAMFVRGQHSDLAGPAPICAYLIFTAAFYLVVSRLSGSVTLLWLAAVLLVVDALAMLVSDVGYASMTGRWTVWASLGYLLLLAMLAWLAWRQVRPEARTHHRPTFILVMFGGASLSVGVICAQSGAVYAGGLYALSTAVGLVAIHLVWQRRTPGKWSPFWRLVELATIVFAAGVNAETGRLSSWQSPCAHGQACASSVWTTGHLVTIVLASLALIALIVVLLDRVRQAARVNAAILRVPGAVLSSGVIEVLSGIGLTAAVMGLFVPYDWFVDRGPGWFLTFSVSLIAMAVALLVVGLGLWSRVKALRLYGLVVVIASVLKLVTLDIGSVDSITRVAAFLGGAAICFGISALYNYAAKKFDKALDESFPETGPRTTPH
jgi:hypothetical protein